MEELSPKIAQEVWAVALPLLYTMLIGLAIGLVAATLLAVFYRKMSGKSGALAGVLGVLLLGGAGFLLPLSLNFERAGERLTSTIVRNMEPELERMVAAEGLDPHNLDSAEIRRAVDHFLNSSMRRMNRRCLHGTPSGCAP